MRRLAAGCFSLLLASGCSAAPATSQPPSPSPTATQSVQASPDAYVGAYRTGTGQTLLVNFRGDLVNIVDGSIRQLSATSQPDHFTTGPAYQVPTPKRADVVFHLVDGRADRLAVTAGGGLPVTATRLAFKETEVHIPAGDATLAGTVTEPLASGPHPGIVIVHGSGPGPRTDYGVWVGLYASLGLTVLAYDKRGNGQSTGTYPGEQASDRTLTILADDAAKVLSFLTTWPGVDPKRVGFHGGSQGGWISPLAMERNPIAAFAVLVSGPAVTVGQQGLWASFSSGSRRMPDPSQQEMDSQIRADSSGYDPGPVLRATNQPIIWLNGATDRQVPTAINTEVLRGLAKPQWVIEVLPGTSHGLLLNPSGLTQDDLKATNFAPGLFDKIAGWLAAHA